MLAVTDKENIGELFNPLVAGMVGRLVREVMSGYVTDPPADPDKV